MNQKLLTSAVFAGVGAGLIAALLQFYFVIPTLLEGELFEGGTRVHFGADGSPQSERGAPSLGGEFGRHLMTVGFNIVTYVGFGFLLLAAMAITEMKGFSTITARSGIIWGLCGFIAIQLAPAIGLPFWSVTVTVTSAASPTGTLVRSASAVTVVMVCL